jgi:hypothetical protein
MPDDEMASVSAALKVNDMACVATTNIEADIGLTAEPAGCPT